MKKIIHIEKKKLEEDKFSYELMELGWLLHNVLKGEEELTNEKIEQIYKAICRSQKIVQTLEIRKRSLNNLRDEIDSYMEEFNELVD